jgi:hypothetical protein
MPYIPLSAGGAPTGTYTPLVAKGVAPTPAPAPSAGYVPLSGKAAPVSTVTPTSPTFQGAGYGASNIKDVSGKPLLTYENEQAKSSQLLSDRTALPFDFTKPQKITPEMLKNGRMPESVSAAIKSSVGGTAAQELDHIMPLELGGSNQKSNLHLEANVPGTRNTPTDPLENQLARKAMNGEISVLDAWRQMAKAKNLPLREDQQTQRTGGATDIAPTYETGAGGDVLKAYPSTMQTLVDLQIDPLSLKADPTKAISSAWDSIKGSVAQEAENIKNLFSSKSVSEAVGGTEKTIAGAAVAVLSPLTALFSGADKIPILGTVSRLISLPFQLLGDAGPDTAKVIVDKLSMISQKAKNDIVDGTGQMLALAGQFALGKISADVLSEKKAALEARFGAEDAKTIVDKAQQMAQAKATETPKVEVRAPAVETMQTARPLPESVTPKETSVTLASGLNLGLDKFVKEDVGPALSRVKEAGTAVVNGLRAVKDAIVNIIEPAKPVERANPEGYAAAMRMIHTPEAEALSFDNARSRTFDSNFKKLEGWFGKYSEKELKDFNLTRGMPESSEAQALQREAGAKLRPELQDPALKTSIKEASDYVYDYAKKNGIDLNYFEDYFYGTYKDAAKVSRFLDYWRSTERYTKEKTLPTIADAANFGLELKNQNPIANIRSEMMAVAQRVGLKQLRDRIETGDISSLGTLTEKAGPDQLRNWAKINDSVFNGMLFEPKFARLVNNLISTNKVSSNLFLRGIRQTTYLSQQVKFLGSIFHMQNMLRGSIASEMGGIVNPKGWADFVKSFKPVDATNPVYKEFVNLGGGHRYSIESQAESQLTTLVHRIETGNYLGGILRIPATILESKYIPPSPGFIHWMFDDFIPKLKFEKFQQDVAAREAKLGRVLRDPEKLRIIKNNQNFYGEMNERLFGRSGTVTSALRLIFQAPGYGEGNFRALARASIGDKKSAQFVVNSLITTLTVSTLGTKILTGNWPALPKNPDDLRDLFKIKTNLKDGNGDDVYFDMMTYDKDYWSVYGNMISGKAGQIPADLNTRVAGMTSTPYKILTDLGTLFKGEMIYDYKGDPVYRPTDTLPEKMQKMLARELQTAQPISVSTFGQSQQKGVDTATSLIQSIIGIRPGTSENVKEKKQIISDLMSLRDEKDKRQIELNKLAGENVDEAKKQRQEFNQKQQAKLKEILKGQQVQQIPTHLFYIQNLRVKPPKQGTDINSVLK